MSEEAAPKKPGRPHGYHATIKWVVESYGRTQWAAVIPMVGFIFHREHAKILADLHRAGSKAHETK